jgi:hypothetical protein
MPSSRQLIASQVLGTTASSVTFSSIPGTFKDLILRISARNADAVFGRELRCTFNANTGSLYSYIQLSGSGTTAASTSGSSLAYGVLGSINGGGTTANTFGSMEVYIPSYLASANKPLSSYAVTELNSDVNNQIKVEADLFRSTTAISSIELFLNSGNFDTGSSFYLYGIKNS